MATLTDPTAPPCQVCGRHICAGIHPDPALSRARLEQIKARADACELIYLTPLAEQVVTQDLPDLLAAVDALQQQIAPRKVFALWERPADSFGASGSFRGVALTRAEAEAWVAAAKHVYMTSRWVSEVDVLRADQERP